MHRTVRHWQLRVHLVVSGMGLLSDVEGASLLLDVALRRELVTHINSTCFDRNSQYQFLANEKM